MNIKLTSLINEILNESLEELKDKRIHVSEKEIENLQSANQINNRCGKPSGGLFYAMGDTWISEYLVWDPKRLYASKHIYEVILSPSARIAAPKTYDEYLFLTKKYGRDDNAGYYTDEDRFGLSHKSLDYSKLIHDFDGIEAFEVNGKQPASIGMEKEPKLYWPGEFDPPHGAIWNKNAAKLRKLDVPLDYIKQVKFKRYRPDQTPPTTYHSHSEYDPKIDDD